MNGRSIVMVFASLAACAAPALAEQPSAAAVAGFDTYTRAVETRLGREHRTGSAFVMVPAQTAERLRNGEVIIEQVTPDPAPAVPGAMLVHWRGTAFVAGVTAADFESMMRNFSEYPRIYAPQVVEAHMLSEDGDRIEAMMRTRQKHVLTVVLDATYDGVFGRLDEQHRFSLSRSKQIDEIEGAGTAHEHALTPAENHGFLWRLNTYWTCVERDGGIYMQIETVSLTRSIPAGLGWVVGPFVEKVPRESLEFTLRATCAALRKSPGDTAGQEQKSAAP
ncbi:MAG TPA: hypothetical protein VKB38_13000 [Terracidiphilus sp.]|nr:hypothetical protein [Terracidiphilus sp.]